MNGEHLLTVGGLLRDAGVPAGEGEPVLAHGHRDRAGNWRRIHARYASHLRVTMVIRVDGTYSISFAIKFLCRVDAQGDV